MKEKSAPGIKEAQRKNERKAVPDKKAKKAARGKKEAKKVPGKKAKKQAQAEPQEESESEEEPEEEHEEKLEDGGKPTLKKGLKLSRRTGNKHRGAWSCSYEAGFESVHRQAVARIQKAYRRYRAWKNAKEMKAAILQQREKLGKKDHLGRALLVVFNLAGIVFSLSGAGGVWYYLINCPPALGGVDMGPQLCVDTLANRVLLNMQLAFAVLCAIGLRSVNKDRLAWLRGYSFFLLLMVAAQLSLVGMFLLDRSAAVAGMKEGTMAAFRDQACTLDTVVEVSLNSTDLSRDANTTVDEVRQWLGVEALCSCTKSGQECFTDWLEPRLDKMVGVFCVFSVLQIAMAHFAWRFLAMPSAPSTEEGKSREVKLWLEANDLQLYEKQFAMNGIRTKEKLLSATLVKVQTIGMSRSDMRKFLQAQNDTKVQELNMQDHLGLSGWDKLVVSATDVDDLNINVKIMTKTMYFELTVLASVGLCMWVLALDSRTFPPTDDMAVVMASAQVFVTIFLTLEMILELVVSVTSIRGLKAYFSNSWHILDMCVLAIFWLYQFYPVVRGWIIPLDPALAGMLPEVTPAVLSMLRTLRVLRPLRTLRLLGDLTVVAGCIAENTGLFRDAVFFVAVLISLFAMVGTSSFHGALHYTCVRCDSYDVTTLEQLQSCAMGDRRVYEGTTLVTGEAGWVRADTEGVQAQWTTNSTDLLVCPQSLTCAQTARDDGTFVRCIERDVLDVGEDGTGSRSFDNFFSAFYTMFILLSGDNGMQDIPNALFAVDASSEWLAWPICFVASFGLTLVSLNIVLAICCSVFEDIHAALEHTKQQRAEAAEVQQAMAKLDDMFDKQERDRKAKEAAAGTRGALARADDGLENLLESGAKAVMGAASGMRSKFLDSPESALGLQNIEAKREEMDREMREKAEERSTIAQHIVTVGRSKLFEVIVMVMIVFYTLSVMNQEDGTNGIDEMWVNIELMVMIFFVLEWLLVLIGLGGVNYFRYGENRLDFLILLCTIAGHIATHQMAAVQETQARALAALATSRKWYSGNGTTLVYGGNGTASMDILSQVNTESEIALRLIKMLRILQMFRMTYKYKTMREILKKVFKTGSTIIYLLIFVVFVLTMCALVMMHLVGGGCDEKYNPNVQQLWGEETCAYPDANFESFNVGVFTALMIMIGEDWSEIMFWYNAYSPIGNYAAPLFMGMWFLVHGVLFSLFVAVLLLNFGMDEDDKMPLQKEQYDAYQLRKKHGQHTSIVDAQAVEAYERAEGKAMNIGAADLHVRLEEAANAVVDGERTMEHKSLFIFFLNHPVRVFCARVEQSVYFEALMISLICLSCISVAIEGPGCDSLSIDALAAAALAAEVAEAAKECPKNSLESVFATVGYLVLGALILELVLRSISTGFLLRSGPTRPYLRNKQNLVDFLIILVILGTHTADMWLSNVGEHPKSISLVRAMAPMFSLVRNRGLRQMFRAFSAALPLIATVAIPIVFMMMMMSVVAVDLFGNGRMRQCMATGNMISYLDGADFGGYNRTQCAIASENGEDVEWINPPFNFDNAYAGLATLFKAATAGVMPMHNVGRVIAGPGLAPEGASWVKVVRNDGSIYSTEEAPPPSMWTTITYFSAYHAIFTFFLMNLFIGVMSESFSKSTGTIMITTFQRRWMQCQAMVDKFRPYADIHEEYRPMPGDAFFRVRLGCFTVTTNRHFHNFVSLVIVSNCFILLLEHYPADESWSEMIDVIDIGFLTFYCVEMTSMMIGLGVSNYFKSGWNTFDFLLVTSSMFTAVAGTTSGIEGLRVLRSLRLFLLMQQLAGVMGLIDTVVHALPPAATVGAIMAVFFYIYAIFGMRSFGSTVIEHQGGYYDDNNNFDSFPNACKLLAQVLLGQNYMWLTADLVSEGHDETTVFLYFASFFIINVLININLFAVVVLDNFAAQNPVAQTVLPRDLWCFTYVWAELTVGAAACPGLQKGRAAAAILNNHDSDDDGDDDADDAFEICADTGKVLKKADGSIVKGNKALQYTSRIARNNPKGVVEVNVVDFTGLRIRDEGDCFYGAKPFVQLYSKPHGRSHPEHTAIQTKVSGHGNKQKVEFGDGNGEQFNIFLNERAKNITFEIIDSRDSKKLAQASISVQELVKYTNAIDPEDLTLDLTGAKKRLDEATPEELEHHNARESPKSPRSPSPATGEESPRLPKGSGVFFPVIGQIHIEVVFKEGEALPTFGFMSDFHDNQEHKEQGCGLEGWVWKESGGLHSKWERRWMWISTVKTLPNSDPYPEMYFNLPKHPMFLRVAKLKQDVADAETKVAKLGALPKKERKKKETKAAIADEEHRLSELQQALKKATAALEGAAQPIGYYSSTPGKSDKVDVMKVGGWRDPNESHKLGPEQQNEIGLYYYKEVDDEGEMEDFGRRGKLKANFVPASQICDILDHIEGSNTATAHHFGHTERDATRLFDSEFQFTRRAHTNEHGKERKESVYKCRAMSPQIKAAWVASLKWLTSGTTTTDEQGRPVYTLESERPGLLPHPPLNDRDLVRVKNNPSLVPLPFCHVRHLLTHPVYRQTTLGNHRLTREWMMYIAFNLEMKCMQDLTEKKGHTRRAHIGEYLEELRGLDYHKVLRQLCLLHYHKRLSLMYPQQVEEYKHDLRKVALNMITCAVSGWIYGKALPKYHEKRYGKRMKQARKVESVQERKDRHKELKRAQHVGNKYSEMGRIGDDVSQHLANTEEEGPNRWDTYPVNPVWRKRPAAHTVAATGVAACRLESLKFLFRAIKKEEPALLAQQEREELAEKQRVAALSKAERDAEEHEKALRAELEEDDVSTLVKCFKRSPAEDPVHQSFSNPMMLGSSASDDEENGNAANRSPRKSQNPMLKSSSPRLSVFGRFSKSSEGADAAPQAYRTLTYGIYRVGWDKRTAEVGYFRPGDEVVVLEERGKRVRTEKGWITKLTESGKPLLEKSVAVIDQDGDEHTLSMVDDANRIVEEPLDNGGPSPHSQILKFDNPLDTATNDEISGDEDSGSDSDNESLDEDGKTRRERKEDSEFERLFLEHGGKKGFLDKNETIALVSSLYSETLQAEHTTAAHYVNKHYTNMCRLSSSEQEGFGLEAWRKWDASEDVVSLRLGRQRAKRPMTKEELYQLQHQDTYEEAQRLTREVFAMS